MSDAAINMLLYGLMTSVLEPIVYGAVGFLLCRRAEARTRTFLEAFPVKLSTDYGRGNESERGLLVDKIAITPEVVLALEGTASLKWHVQSTDVDDRQEFLSLDESLIRAGARACERKIREGQR